MMSTVGSCSTSQRPGAALDAGRPDPGGVASLGDIVMVEPVRAARDRGKLDAADVRAADAMGPMVGRRSIEVDAILWCTGYRPDLRHLAPLALLREGTHPATEGTRAKSDPRVHLIGYGDWTGPASATLIGVGRTAREAVKEMMSRLESERVTAP